MLQEEFASHELSQHSGLRKTYSCHAEAGKSPAVKQTYRKQHEGHKLPAFCCQGVRGTRVEAVWEEVTWTRAAKGAEVGAYSNYSTYSAHELWSVEAFVLNIAHHRHVSCQYRGLSRKRSKDNMKKRFAWPWSDLRERLILLIPKERKLTFIQKLIILKL